MLVLSVHICHIKLGTQNLSEGRKLCFKHKGTRVVQACHPSIWGAEAGVLLKFKLAWVTEGRLDLNKKILDFRLNILYFVRYSEFCGT